jgi:membrane protein DedA with SNARE-associated domain
VSTEAQSVDGEQKTEDGDTPSTVVHPPSSRARTLASILLMGAILVGFSALVFIFREQIIRLSQYGYLGLFVIAAVSSASVLVPVPGLALAFATGGALNPLGVGLAIGTGAAVGELIGYAAGVGGHGLVADNSSYQRVSVYMKRYGMWAVFGLAVIPNPLFDIVGIVSGVLRIPVWRFFFACWAGNVIKATVIAFAGMGAITVLAPVIQRWIGK